MYDRAPRDLVKPFGSTGLHVGPGSYDPDVPPKARFKAGMFHNLFVFKLSIIIPCCQTVDTH